MSRPKPGTPTQIPQGQRKKRTKLLCPRQDPYPTHTPGIRDAQLNVHLASFPAAFATTPSAVESRKERASKHLTPQRTLQITTVPSQAKPSLTITHFPYATPACSTRSFYHSLENSITSLDEETEMSNKFQNSESTVFSTA